jgi:hypothetical protein
MAMNRTEPKASKFSKENLYLPIAIAYILN